MYRNTDKPFDVLPQRMRRDLTTFVVMASTGFGHAGMGDDEAAHWLRGLNASQIDRHLEALALDRVKAPHLYR